MIVDELVLVFSFGMTYCRTNPKDLAMRNHIAYLTEGLRGREREESVIEIPPQLKVLD